MLNFEYLILKNFHFDIYDKKKGNFKKLIKGLAQN